MRRRINTKRICLTTVIAVMFVIALITFIRLVNVGADDSQGAKYKYFTSYTIEPNDTLTTIAEKFTENTNVSVAEYIDEVKVNNNLIKDKITEGKKIIVAYYSDDIK